jgi:general secretion pathway protein E
MEDLEQTAKKFLFKFVTNLDEYRFVKEKVTRISYLFAKQKKILPIDESSENIIIALSDPFNLSIINEVEFLLNKPCIAHICPLEEIEKAISICYQKEQEINLDRKNSFTSEEYDLLENTSDNPVIQVLNQIFIGAIEQKASDIHFQPQESELVVKFRLDGVLQEKHVLSKAIQTQISSRIKVLAKLDIAEKRLPQDGRIKLWMKEKEIDFRVSTIPTVYGERLVLRILDKGNVALGLNNIGLQQNELKLLRKWIDYPEGILLVTGPTGSGKTTTLYSAILEMNPSEKNIITIEDPVEYKIPNIAQISVNPKINLNFSAGLRHILRQDPDVILIGEIRDQETAQIAIKASLTGHLVLSTLHTNDAPSAITRLANMGIERYLLASSIIGVVAQRLVRKICSYCRESYFPSSEELKELGVFSEIPIRFFKGTGCKNCYQTGYKGRCAVYEIMNIDSKMKESILYHTDSLTLRKTANLKNIRDSGIELIKKGLTTSAEVLRVTKD